MFHKSRHLIGNLQIIFQLFILKVKEEFEVECIVIA